MAVGTLAAYTTCSEKGVMRLYAQQDRRAATTSSSSGQTRSLTVHHFEIAPGALHDVLDTFQRTAGVQILVPQQTVLSIWSPGVNGLYTLEQAVQKILVGTGLVYRFTTPTTVIVEIAGPSTTVEVTTNVLPDTLPKYTEPLLDTPQTISVVSHNVMETQGTTTLRDALRNVAGISLAAGEGGAQGDSLTIRGFTARNDIFLDGMRDFGSYYRDPFDMQEVDVLQGPASVVFWAQFDRWNR